ncbi:MAG TPA: FkbM family methyltransferase, partial [Fusibacter sp.]|nr:FkbM family methyltransferase [Fusibacter sp.]
TGQLEKELFFLREIVSSGGRAIDIGANRGLYSYALSQYHTVVEAFEPQPYCSQVITAYSSFSKNKINVHNCGLSNIEGELSLYIPEIRGRLRNSLATGLASFKEEKPPGNFSIIKVPVCKLDSYNFQDVSVIKVDVEGHEKEVIEGAKQTILRNKPILLIEIEQRHLKKTHTVHSIIQYIETLGYRGYFLDNKGLKDVNCLGFEASAENCRNFIFKPMRQSKP